VAHPRGAVWGNFHPKRLWLIAVWHPFDINAPLLAPVEVETEIKKYSKSGVANTSIAIDRSIAESQLVDRA